MSKIELSPGRLALRRPELGPLRIITVGELFERTPDALPAPRYGFHEADDHLWTQHNVADYLPVLREGDEVPIGSLLLNPYNNRTQVWDEYTNYVWEILEPGAMLPLALLRYGPEDA